MIEEMGQGAHNEQQEPADDTDEEFVFSDWYDGRAGTCRGEAEAVLGVENTRWDPVAWALSTGSRGDYTEPSANKACRNSSDDNGSGNELQTTPVEMVSGERSFAPTDEATWPKHPLLHPSTDTTTPALAKEVWKPMSAVKLRAAAKRDAQSKEQAAKEALARTNAERNKPIWKEAFSSDQPLPIDEAADLYAAWASSGRHGELASESAFEASATYTGCRVGWIFKTGGLGTGYYRDGVPEARVIDLHRILWPTANLEPVQLRLDEMIVHKKVLGDPIKATTEDDPEDMEKKVKRTRKQKREASRAAKAKGAMEILLEDVAVNLNDKSHRDKGWWALDSGNPNAWKGATEILASSSADAMAVQETRVESSSICDAENTARNLGWNMAVGRCDYGEGGGASSGVAVGCRKHIGLSESCSEDMLPVELKARFMVKHVGAVCKGGFHFASGYLHTRVGIQHAANLDWLQAAAGVLSTLKGPWVLAADFNCTPQQLEDTGWLAMVGGKIVAPQLETCFHRVIDFFVVSNNMAEMVVGAATIDDALCKPHKPVRLYLRAGVRTMVVRALKKLGKFGAVLPHGPAKDFRLDPTVIEAMTNNEKYQMFLTRMEQEVMSLHALDE